MPFYLPLTIPPGMVRPGTVYDARGRWYDGTLVRWHEGALQPWGGWSILSGAESSEVSGSAYAVRGMYAWRRSGGVANVALGTAVALKVYSAGSLTDITPAVFTPGQQDASGTYYNRIEAQTWHVDSFGEDLVACAYSDGQILYWDSSAGGDAAALANAPTNCTGVVVSPERFVVALGADGDRRLVKWSDQENATDWTAASTNQAGDFTLPGSGQITVGRPGQNETLIWTDVDLFAMRYIGGTLVYSFRQVGSNCGALSRLCVGMVGGQAFWMGTRSFFVYDGFVREIPCEVGDYVFNRINREQASKVCAVVNTDFNEVTWFYPSTGTENDSYATLDTVSGEWSIGSLARTSGVDRGFLEYPLMSSPLGAIYQHESGTSYVEEDATAYTPYVESGPIEIGNGDRLLDVVGYVPDEETLGEVQTRIYSRLYPTDTETTHGPFTNANPTSVRITARQVRVRHTQVAGGWRVGTPRLEVQPGSGR